VTRHWVREIAAVVPEARVVVIGERAGATARGRAPAGNDELAIDAGTWLVTTYDILSRWAGRLVRIRWAGVIFDEAHHLRQQTRQRTAGARRVVEATPEAVVYALTGTSLLHRPRDLFPLLQIAGHPLGRSYKAFARQYCLPHDVVQRRGGDAVSQIEDLALQLRGVMLRRSHEEVRSLPPKFRTWLAVDVPPDTGARELRAVIRTLIDSRLATRSRGSAPASPERSRADRMRLLAQLTTARRKVAAAKVPLTTDLVQSAVEQGEKVLVFSCFNEPLRKIRAHFGDSALLLTGSTPAKRRQKIIARFQGDPALRVLAANIVAGGLGPSLTAARQVVFNDLDWVAANHWHAEDRVARAGRTGTVNVSYLVGAGTVDEFVQRVLETKAAMVSTVVESDAVAAQMGADVLTELERALTELAPRLGDGVDEALEQGRESQVLRQIAALLDGGAAEPPAPLALAASGLSREALLRLADVLGGAPARRYRAASPSSPGAFFTVDVSGSGDVVCSCAAFERRGRCDHALRLEGWLSAGGPLPEGYVPES
jgi:SWI/SNF-related matrix-associated actin-dependent regulator 1 of chromatin subfamily A